MSDLFSIETAELARRVISPERELGAYEALWARDGTSFKRLATMFARHAGSIPSDFVSPGDAESHARLALGALSDAGIAHFGIQVRGVGDYPDKLTDAEKPVQLLYFQGNWDIVATRCVAVIGTRHPSADGERRAAKLGRLLVADGFTVVSGLAKGIDTIAHRSAIEAHGLTIAVAGTPINHSYPPQNADLQRQIADRHLLISQVPIVRYSRQTPHENRLFFPERNITMSALSEASVIVEAGPTSGALIEARHALQQGRKLFILESCFHDASLAWPRRFVERGAIRVSELEEITRQLAS